ncbi:MAG TPA: HAD-IIA family hydrolase [Acidimicrobiales bacterium]|nr:HAD-IIA family hydrolase [Acidimicrobiales bacterium]
MTWALDLDGVVWLAGERIPGAPEAVAMLRAAGERVVFLTNNSGPLLEGHVEALGRSGIEADPSDIATSSQAAAQMLDPGSDAAVIGDEGLRQALSQRGVDVVPPGAQAGTVVVGRTLDLDYDELSAAAEAVRDGARFIATNTDATFPTPGRLLPGAGALIAFVATASGRQPEVAGKPHPPMASLVRARYGDVSVMVGDRPDTDGLFAELVGARFGLVLSGVTSPADLPVDPAPAFVSADLRSLVEALISCGPGS